MNSVELAIMRNEWEKRGRASVELESLTADKNTSVSPNKFAKLFGTLMGWDPRWRSAMGQNVCHIIAKKNGGADHPDNYVIADARFNQKSHDDNDEYYAAIVGHVRVQGAVDISRSLGTYGPGPSAHTLYDDGIVEALTTLDKKKRKKVRKKAKKKAKKAKKQAKKQAKKAKKMRKEANVGGGGVARVRLGDTSSEVTNTLGSSVRPRRRGKAARQSTVSGVTWHKPSQKWQVHCRGRAFGTFATEAEAIAMRQSLGG